MLGRARRARLHNYRSEPFQPFQPFAPKQGVSAEKQLPALTGALPRGRIPTPIIAKGPATLGTAWESHGKRLYHSFTVRKD